MLASFIVLMLWGGKQNRSYFPTKLVTLDGGERVVESLQDLEGKFQFSGYSVW